MISGGEYSCPMENTEFMGLDNQYEHFEPAILDNWQDCGKSSSGYTLWIICCFNKFFKICT